eukprot:INCI4079.4.p1 GENE.INCI4079.4~~INCI4079.4.p1  ORF type:complete len:1082 (-),score=194.22 INCI4079.4:31-3219(-)
MAKVVPMRAISSEGSEEHSHGVADADATQASDGGSIVPRRRIGRGRSKGRGRGRGRGRGAGRNHNEGSARSNGRGGRGRGRGRGRRRRSKVQGAAATIAGTPATQCATGSIVFEGITPETFNLGAGKVALQQTLNSLDPSSKVQVTDFAFNPDGALAAKYSVLSRADGALDMAKLHELFGIDHSALFDSLAKHGEAFPTASTARIADHQLHAENEVDEVPQKPVVFQNLLSIAGLDRQSANIPMVRAEVEKVLNSQSTDGPVEITHCNFGDDGILNVKYSVLGPSDRRARLKIGAESQGFDVDPVDLTSKLRDCEAFAAFPSVTVAGHKKIAIEESGEPDAFHAGAGDVAIGEMTIEGLDASDVANPKITRVMNKTLNEMRLQQQGAHVERLEVIDVAQIGVSDDGCPLSKVRYKIHLKDGAKSTKNIIAADGSDDDSEIANFTHASASFKNAMKRHATNEGMAALSRRGLKLRGISKAKAETSVAPGDAVEDLDVLAVKKVHNTQISGKFSLCGSKLSDLDINQDVTAIVENAICDIPYELGLDPNACKISVQISQLDDGKRYLVQYKLDLEECDDATELEVRQELESEISGKGNFIHALIRKAKAANCLALRGVGSVEDCEVDELQRSQRRRGSRRGSAGMERLDTVAPATHVEASGRRTVGNTVEAKLGATSKSIDTARDSKGGKRQEGKGSSKRQGGLSLLGITGAMVASGKLFKTLRGSVVIKGTTSQEFQQSHTMFQALQDVLQKILVSTGIEPRELRLKLTHSVDKASIKAGRSACQVFYRIRLRGEAKNVAEAIVLSLKHTFSDRTQRKKFLDGFWELSTAYEWEDVLSQFHSAISGADSNEVQVQEVKAFLAQMDSDGKGSNKSKHSLAPLVLKSLESAGKPALSLEDFLKAMSSEIVPQRRAKVIEYLKHIQEYCEMVNSMHMDEMADFVNGAHDSSTMSQQWRTTLQKCYQMMDGDDSKTVTLNEMLSFFGKTHEVDVVRCFEGIDTNHDRAITLDEFVHALADASPPLLKMIKDMVSSVDEIGAISMEDLEDFVNAGSPAKLESAVTESF